MMHQSGEDAAKLLLQRIIHAEFSENNWLFKHKTCAVEEQIAEADWSSLPRAPDRENLSVKKRASR
jgi:hypothetical protein